MFPYITCVFVHRYTFLMLSFSHRNYNNDIEGTNTVQRNTAIKIVFSKAFVKS